MIVITSSTVLLTQPTFKWILRLLVSNLIKFYIHMTAHHNKFIFDNQPDASIIQIYSVTKLCMFRASPLPLTRSFLPYIEHWSVSCRFDDRLEAVIKPA